MTVDLDERAKRVLTIVCILLGLIIVPWCAWADDAEATARFGEPFGVTVVNLPESPLRAKWQEFSGRLDDDRVQLAFCDGNREGCPSPAALQLLAIIDHGRQREGRARLGEINRAINLAVRSMSDEAQHGQTDVWSTPLATFASGAGDCEDYAIAKALALRFAGLADEDVRIVIMRDTIRGEDHAVATARLDGQWLVLDNRRMAMIEVGSIRNFRPMYVIGGSDIMKYVPAPLLASVSADVAPATIP